MIPDEKRLPASLLALRLTVFLVMALWSVDKILNPGHAAGVFETFYFIEGIGPTMLAGCLALFLLREEDTMWSLDEALRGGDVAGERTAAGNV